MGQPSLLRESRAGTALDDAYASRSAIVAAVDATYDRLTSRNAALLLIDHQIGPLWELDFAETRRVVVALTRAATRLQIPCILTAIAPETWGSVIPELTNVVSDTAPIVRNAVNAWEESAVRAAIERAGRRKLIVAGGAAAVAVALCALSASEAGYDVYTPLDASAQFSHAAIRRLSRANVIVTTTSLIMAELGSSRNFGNG